jgi:hypothetical protein
VGLSDTFTGAFWVADALFAFANAGANGFHLHWGKGGDLNGDSQPNTGVQTNFEKVSIHATHALQAAVGAVGARAYMQHMRCRRLWGPEQQQQQQPAASRHNRCTVSTVQH